VDSGLLELQNRSLGLIRVHGAELHLSNANDVEREAIGAESFDRFFIRGGTRVSDRARDLLKRALLLYRCRVGEPTSRVSGPSISLVFVDFGELARLN
jgi:hypothetical protein